MVKPINITPLNTTNTLQYKCEKCGDYGTISLDSIINTDNAGNPKNPLDDYECQKCGEKLWLTKKIKIIRVYGKQKIISSLWFTFTKINEWGG